MREIILHIGTHKTGTTTLQRWLAGAAPILAEYGVLYPRAGRPRSGPRYGHHLVPWSIADMLRGRLSSGTEQIWSGLETEWDASGLSRLLLSAEGLENLDSRGIRALRERLPSGRVLVLIYLRNPLDFLVSLFKQRVKKGHVCEGFAEFCAANIHRVDYPALLGRWLYPFGVEAILVRRYDSIAREPGVVADALSALGLPASELTAAAVQGKRYNPTPSEDMLRLIQWLNRRSPPQSLQPFSEPAAHALRRALVWLDRFDGGRAGARLARRLPPLIEPDELAAARDLCTPYLDGLIDPWLPESDRSWFGPARNSIAAKTEPGSIQVA